MGTGRPRDTPLPHSLGGGVPGRGPWSQAEQRCGLPLVLPVQKGTRHPSRGSRYLAPRWGSTGQDGERALFRWVPAHVAGDGWRRKGHALKPDSNPVCRAACPKTMLQAGRKHRTEGGTPGAGTATFPTTASASTCDHMCRRVLASAGKGETGGLRLVEVQLPVYTAWLKDRQRPERGKGAAGPAGPTRCS